MADDAGLSPYHFLRTFEQVAGVTPHQYIRRTRLREAALQLASDSDKILDVALDSGAVGGGRSDGVTFGVVANGGSYSFTFTNFQNVSVTAVKLQDLTGDGQSPDDIPIQGWEITLAGTTESGVAVSLTQTTDSSGHYSFANLDNGTYTVSETLRQGWISTSPVSRCRLRALAPPHPRDEVRQGPPCALRAAHGRTAA